MILLHVTKLLKQIFLNFRRVLILPFICLVFHAFMNISPCHAQNISSNEIWAGANLGYKVNSKISLSGSHQFRYSDRENTFSKQIFNLGGKYKINKRVSLGGTRKNFRFHLCIDQEFKIRGRMLPPNQPIT